MLNQLISDKNKKLKKRTRVEDICDNIINGIDNEISTQKKTFISPPIKENSQEQAKLLTKSQRFIKEIQTTKQNKSVFMTDLDIKNSKRIQNMFKNEKNLKKPNLQQVNS